MRIRQTYQPGYLQVPQTERQQRIVYSYGKEMKTPEIMKPLSSLVNLRLFLYKTKQKLEYKKASQFSRTDHLIHEQPSFLFNKSQTELDNQIKFQAYLDGDLKPQEYLILQNYKRLYDTTKKNDPSLDESYEEEYYIQKESPLKKLKERIIHRYNMNKRKRVSGKSSQVESNCETPAKLLANQIKKTIISKYMNKINESLTAEKQLKQLKFVQEAEYAITNIQNQIKQNVSPLKQKDGLKKINRTKELKIISNQQNKEQLEFHSTFSLNEEVRKDANSILKKFFNKQQQQQNQDLIKQKKITFSQTKLKQITKDNYSFMICKPCKTERSQIKINNLRSIQNIKKSKMESNSFEDRNDSAASSLCSLYEQKVTDLYNQTIWSKKNMKNKETLIKRIKHIQNYNQIIQQSILTNNEKLLNKK